MLNRAVFGIALAVACAGPPAGPQRTVRPGRAHTLYTIERARLGPLTPTTRATLASLRTALNPDGVRVEAVDDGGPRYHAFLGDEPLFYVVPGVEAALYNVHVVSGRIATAGHSDWIVGEVLRDAAALTHCECWGTGAVCYREREHVALAFDVRCDPLDAEAVRLPDPRYRIGAATIQRVVWSPSAFPE